MGFRPKNIPQRLKPFRFSRHVSARLKPRPFKTPSRNYCKSTREANASKFLC